MGEQEPPTYMRSRPVLVRGEADLRIEAAPGGTTASECYAALERPHRPFSKR